MNLQQYISDRLKTLGLTCEASENSIIVKRDIGDLSLYFDDEWEFDYENFKKARSINYENSKRILHHNNKVEFLISKLSNSLTLSDVTVFNDKTGNTVEISQASKAFYLSFFKSEEYEKFFETRIKRLILNSRVNRRGIYQIFGHSVTAKYTHKGRKTPHNINDIALKNIKSSLFKLSVEQNECYILWNPKKNSTSKISLTEKKSNFTIPQSDYDENVVSYYKVAKSSPFQSQSYLAYYHVLEYYFLKVGEEILHDKLGVILNNTNFRTNNQSLERIISLVKGHNARENETEMLKNVLDKFIISEDLIKFIKEIEEVHPKIYTGTSLVFGENIHINIKNNDQAIAYTANALKHIRNSIVHSSDKYTREDRYIPLSESDEIIEKYIPLVRFCAEQVIYGNAN